MKSFAQLAHSPHYWLSQLQNRLFGTVEKFRTDRGWTRTQLAEHLGVSKGYVSQILNGDFDHRLSKLIQLSLAVGVVPDIRFTPVDDYVREYLSGADRAPSAVALPPTAAPVQHLTARRVVGAMRTSHQVADARTQAELVAAADAYLRASDQVATFSAEGQAAPSTSIMHYV